MYKIQTLNKISPSGLEHFHSNKYTYGNEITSPDAIMVRSASMHEMDFSSDLLAIARAGAGVNNIPVDKCSEDGIVVFNTPGANANAVKELVICSLLLSSRKIVSGIDFCKTLKDEGEKVGPLVEKGKSAFAGPEISGKKLGVIGLGAIGVLVANCAKSMGMEVFGYDPYLSVDAAWNLSRSIKHAKSLQEIFSECDYLSLHLPSNKETKDLVNSASISSMKDGIRILNFSRAELVCDDDIIDALQSGKVASYATDFPTHKLIDVNGVIAIPHLGASTPESEDNCARMAVFELIDYLENGVIKNSVNFPDVDLPRSTDCRVCVIHRNIPNVLNPITAPFTAANININNMVNLSKKDYAYTIVDSDKYADESIIKQIREIDGIIRVRVL
ncbi:MAG: phosphoglycerate dehydrogenase [Oscillospiraceae bacterium]|jgi:D-3-phosphoglycerate dehydrogenase|nr:phosphoglycerate dehydrogenase [Oscillospiraceae bacterium]